MHAHVINSYNCSTFNSQILCQVIAIIQKYTDDQIDKETKFDLLNRLWIAEISERAAIYAILALIPNLYDCDVKALSEAHLAASYEHKLAKALGALITKLPPVLMEEDINESELRTRFVDPFLSGLFDVPDNGVYLRWTNETTLETKMQTDLFKHRPDLCITKSYGVKWDTSCRYEEAKPACQGQDHYLVCKDLHKVAVLCKKKIP